MAWNRIIGQDRIKNILQKTILEERIAHSYCFWGIEGVGKDSLAIEFAKAVNCRNPIITENTYEACDECNSCKLASTMQNPNIQLVFSLPAPKGAAGKDDTALGRMTDEQINEIQEQIHIKAENPYYKISLPGANQIKISAVRELKRNLSMTSIQQGRRFIIISRAEEMNVEAANAFLKTLEEPHSNTTIIMTTSAHDRILPTIMSRSQQFHIEPLSDNDIIEALFSKHSIPKDEGKLISAFAQGSYSQAFEYLDSDMKQFRMDAVETLRTSLKRKQFRKELFEKMEEITKKKDKKILEKLFILLMIWIRDALIIARTGSTEQIVNIDQIDTLRKFATNFAESDFAQAIDVIEAQILKIKRNVAPELIFITLFYKLRDIFLNKTSK